ncbi:MAG: sensor histidine kinase [Acidimicrobiales bacterium]
MATILLAALGYRLGLPLGPTAALYLLAASRRHRAPWTPTMTVTVLGLLIAYATARGLANGSFPGIEASHTSLASAVAWFAGERTRLRRSQIADLHERAIRAEREAEQDRLLAVAEERARIARDLHDSAGHAVNVIAVRAGAARLWHDRKPDRSVLALEAIEELARQTVEEIDHMVGTLRDPAAEGHVPATTGLAAIESLVAQHTDAGLEVALTTSGSLDRIGSAVRQATYRILQEALTNAARHGTGGARVTLTVADQAVELVVTNPVQAGSPTRTGGGHGLFGMKERACLLGGHLHTEQANDEFRLRASIPGGGRPA